jgi:hypothetical protein
LDQDLESLRNRLKSIEGATRQIQEILMKLSSASRESLREPLPGYQLLELKNPTPK